MRDAFFSTLCELAGNDSRIRLLIGDLGFGCTREFEEQYPDKFVNAGIAEQNMTGMAAGMAMEGEIVFTYSIANFPLLRCLEQVRNDACYHHLNVKIVCVGAGMCYGSLGASHFSTEDLAITRVLPGLTVFAPGDPIETRAVTKAAVKIDGPVFMRIGRAGEPVVHAGDIDVIPGKALKVSDGDDITLISTGGMLYNISKAAELLRDCGISVRVLSMHTIKPFDAEAVLQAAKETGAIVTVEEHSKIGGLGGAVSEVLAENGVACKFTRMGLPDKFFSDVGSQQYLIGKVNLRPEDICNTAQKIVGSKNVT